MADETEFPSAIPDKEDNLFYNIRDLTAFDITPIPPKGDILAVSRDNVQLLVNRLFTMEDAREKTEDGILLKLPKSDGKDGFRLPREKPIPKVKPPTRWEKFAKEKGIQKKKRSRLVYDENMKDWVPRWGYKSVKQNDRKLNEWALPASEQDPTADPFEKKAAERALVKAKQKMREVRNKMEASGKKVPAGVSGAPQNIKSKDTKVKRGKENLAEILRRAQVSSASMGNFDRKARNEKDAQLRRTKIAHFNTVGDEKTQNLKAVNRILSGDGVVDRMKAARFGQQAAERKNRGKKKGEKGVKKKGKRGR